MEKSYVMIKPEFADLPWVIKEVQNRLEKVGLQITCAGYVNYGKEEARQHYIDYVEKDFFPELEGYLTSGKAYGMVVEGENAIKRIRYIVNGPEKAPTPGSIRYDIQKLMGRELDIMKNVVHASDKPESEEHEERIFRSLLSK